MKVLASGTQLATITAYESDSLTISGAPTGGTLTLVVTWDGIAYTTAAIAYNATAATVAVALQEATGPAGQTLPAMSFVGSGGAWPGTAIVITAQGNLLGPAPITLGTNSLTGGSSPTMTPTRTTHGSSPIVLTSQAGPANMVFVVNTRNMQTADVLVLLISTKIFAESGYEGAMTVQYNGTQSPFDLNKYSVVVPVTHGAQFALEQRAGTARSFDWEVIEV